MNIDVLKSGFWGYQKAGVLQYITSLEEQFSAKLAEKEQLHQDLLSQAQERIRHLESELETLRRQYEAQTAEHLLISSTLLEAQRHAEEMKAQSEEVARAAQQQLEESVARKNAELACYAGQIQQLREHFRSILQDMDNSAQLLSRSAEGIQMSCPDQNMSLFQRNPDSAE